MSDYEKIFISNVRYMAEEKGILFSFIEKRAGLCTGFLSKNKETSRKLSLNSAINISKILEISLEDLLNPDLARDNILKEFKDRLNSIRKEEEEILSKIKELEQ